MRQAPVKAGPIAVHFIFLLVAALLTGCRAIETASESAFQPEDSSPAHEVSPSSEPVNGFEAARLALVNSSIEARGIHNDDVLHAMRSVPRHEFVPAEYLDQAYDDHPLPIGYGQTISQPYIVAWMTELLELQPGEKVLEIGTGSGYQAAVLAELGFVEVYTIEIVPELADHATTRLRELGFDGVHIRQGDGYYGWPEAAPFDAIIVTAAPDHLPAPLAEQLAEGGRLVIPIGPRGLYQSLWQFVKEQGELTAYDMGGVSFVPFIGPGVDEAPRETVP
jgi:protein-L-isoaspartate(D-aspartate) O-methyltransferase